MFCLYATHICYVLEQGEKGLYLLRLHICNTGGEKILDSRWDLFMDAFLIEWLIYRYQDEEKGQRKLWSGRWKRYRERRSLLRKGPVELIQI